MRLALLTLLSAVALSAAPDWCRLCDLMLLAASLRIPTPLEARIA